MTVTPEAATTETEPAPETKTVVRTMHFEVVFPGLRKKRREDLFPRIFDAQDDLRRAANKALMALWMVKAKLIPWPRYVPTRGKNKGTEQDVPLQSLCYQALSGAWQPFGEPLYVPTRDKLSSDALLTVASMLFTRISTDFVDIQMGKKQLPTFRRMPIGTPYIKYDAKKDHFSLVLWGGSGGRITVRPRRMTPRLRSALRRTLKVGDAKLTHHAPVGRKGKWMLSIAVHLPVAPVKPTPIVAAVRLGMHTTCTIAYANIETRTVIGRTDLINLPASTWKAVARVERERKERGEWNQQSRGLRSGKGRKRKIRATAPLSDTIARITDTALQQTAAAVVKTALRAGASVLAVPDLKHWSVRSELERTDPMPERQRAGDRRWYFSLRMNTLKELIKQKAEREGLDTIEINVAGASSTCYACQVHNPDNRHDRRWECSCGVKTSVEVNTSKYLVTRAIEEKLNPTPPSDKKPRRPRKPRKVPEEATSESSPEEGLDVAPQVDADADKPKPKRGRKKKSDLAAEVPPQAEGDAEAKVVEESTKRAPRKKIVR